MANAPAGGNVSDCAFELAALSDVGTKRDHNEDCSGVLVESAVCGVVVVADGVSGALGGEEASRMAVEGLLASWREQGAGVPAGKRLVRAAQQANIEVHEKALFVPELRGMTTTLTAVAVDRGELFAAHVGDSRLYLARGGAATQITKDHTAAAEGLSLIAGAERAKSMLTRSLGRDLICALDRISMPLQQGDVLVICSDGLHNVLRDDELPALLAGRDAASACAALIEAANTRGTPDNLSAAVLRVTGPVPPRQKGLFAQLASALRSP